MKDHSRVLFYKNYDNESYIKIVEEYNKISIEYKGEKKKGIRDFYYIPNRYLAVERIIEFNKSLNEDYDTPLLTEEDIKNFKISVVGIDWKNFSIKPYIKVNKKQVCVCYYVGTTLKRKGFSHENIGIDEAIIKAERFILTL